MLKNQLSNILIKDEETYFFRPDPQFVKEKKWYCRVYLESYDAIEASFITKAIQNIDNKCIEFVVNKYEKVQIVSQQEITLKYIDNFYKDVERDISIRAGGLTNQSLQYLFTKDAENEIFLLFGDKTFIYNAMPVDNETYKYYFQSYFGNWFSEKIDGLLSRIWEEYPNQI